MTLLRLKRSSWRFFCEKAMFVGFVNPEEVFVAKLLAAHFTVSIWLDDAKALYLLIGQLRAFTGYGI